MKAIFLAVALIVLASCAKEAEPSGNLIVTGSVKGLKDGKLFIRKIEDTVMVAVDTIVISGDSSFKTGIELDSPQMFYLEIDRGVTQNIDDRLMFFAEPGKIDIQTTLEHFYADAKITGSKNQQLYEEYNKVKSRYSSQELDLTQAEMDAAIGKKTTNFEAMKAQSEAIVKKKYLHAINFALNHRDSEVAPYIALTEINDAALKYLDTINESLSPKVKASKYGKLLNQYVGELKKSGIE